MTNKKRKMCISRTIEGKPCRYLAILGDYCTRHFKMMKDKENKMIIIKNTPRSGYARIKEKKE